MPFWCVCWVLTSAFFCHPPFPQTIDFYDADGDASITYTEFVPMLKEIMKQIYSAKNDTHNDWAVIQDASTGNVVYFNKRTGTQTSSKPLTYNENATDLLEFNTIVGKDGQSYTVRTNESGNEEYLDFESGQWMDFDDSGASQEGDADAIIYKGNETIYHSSEVTNVFFVDEGGEYAFVPCSFLAENHLIKEKISEIQEWRPTWTNDIEIVMVLQICGYHVASAMVYAEHNSLGLTETEKYSAVSDDKVVQLEAKLEAVGGQLTQANAQIAEYKKEGGYAADTTATLEEVHKVEETRLEGNAEEQLEQLKRQNAALTAHNADLEAKFAASKSESEKTGKLLGELMSKKAASGAGALDIASEWRKKRSSAAPRMSMRPASARSQAPAINEKKEDAPAPVAEEKKEDGDAPKAAAPTSEPAPVVAPVAPTVLAGATAEEMAAHAADLEEMQGLADSADATIADLEVKCMEQTAALAAAVDLAKTNGEEVAALKGQIAEMASNKANDKTPGMIKNIMSLVRQLKDVKEKVAVEFKEHVGSVKPMFSTALAETRAINNKVEAANVDIQVKYRKEIALRKQYYNTIQELKGNIRVFVRVRKDNRGEYEVSGTTFGTFKFPSKTELMLQCVDESQPWKKHEFARVFDPDSTQEMVFVDTKDTIMSVVDGYNVCIMAYGQTGSGKTFTMMGPVEMPGVNRRAIKELLTSLEAAKETVSYTLNAAQVEVYNEGVYDLLSTKPRAETKLKIRQLPKKIELLNLELRPVKTVDDVLKVLTDGDKNRSVSCTSMNSASSRSHLIFLIYVTTTNKMTGKTTESMLTLVDLAGSERVAKSEVSGDGLKEAAAINKSLSALGMVFGALGKKSPHIPYKNSALTHVLSDSLGGQAKCAMFMNCSPLTSNLPETISTLRFAENIAKIELGQAKSGGGGGGKKKTKAE